MDQEQEQEQFEQFLNNKNEVLKYFQKDEKTYQESLLKSYNKYIKNSEKKIYEFILFMLENDISTNFKSRFNSNVSDDLYLLFNYSFMMPSNIEETNEQRENKKNLYKLILQHGFFPDLLESNLRFPENVVDDIFKNIPQGNFPRLLYSELNDEFKLEPMGNWMKRKNEYMKIKNEILSSEVQENTTFTGKLEELKEIYNETCQNLHESYPDMDETNTHEITPDNPVIVFIINGKRFCYNKLKLLEDIFNLNNYFAIWIKNPNASIWNPTDRDFYLSKFNEGYGGKAGEQMFIRLSIGPTSRFFIDLEGIKKLISPPQLLNEKHVVFCIEKKYDNLRIGNINSTFGVSMIHGQVPGETIYTINYCSPESTEIKKLEDFVVTNDKYLSTIYEETMDKLNKEKKANKKPLLDLKSILAKVGIYGFVDPNTNEEEHKQSFTTIFENKEFVKTIPTNGPQYSIGDIIAIDGDSASLSKGEIFSIMREDIPPENPEGTTTWIYEIGPMANILTEEENIEQLEEEDSTNNQILGESINADSDDELERIIHPDSPTMGLSPRDLDSPQGLSPQERRLFPPSSPSESPPGFENEDGPTPNINHNVFEDENTPPLNRNLFDDSNENSSTSSVYRNPEDDGLIWNGYRYVSQDELNDQMNNQNRRFDSSQEENSQDDNEPIEFSEDRNPSVEPSPFVNYTPRRITRRNPRGGKKTKGKKTKRKK